MDLKKSVHVERKLYYFKLHVESCNESSAEDGKSFRCETSDGREAIRKNLLSKIDEVFCSQPTENVWKDNWEVKGLEDLKKASIISLCWLKSS